MLRFLYRLFLVISLTIAAAVIVFRVAAASRETMTATDMLLADSRIAETVHGRLHYFSDGPEDGQTVLLIHGSVGWSGLWQSTTDFLTDAGYRVLALDLPPMGLSDRIAGMDYSRQAQGLRILAFVEELTIEPILVAHSFGAGAAAEALLLEPEKFTGAVIIAGALGLGVDGTGREMPLPLKPAIVREAALSSTVTNPLVTKVLLQQFVHRKDSVSDEIVELLEFPFQREGTTRALAEWLPALLVPPRNAASSNPTSYRALTVPVTLIWGREDTVTPPAQGEALRQALGEAEIFWMDETGHIPQIEAPEDFHRYLAQALAGMPKG